MATTTVLKDNRAFICRTCTQKLRDTKEAYSHILVSYGLILDATLEKKFLMEDKVF